MSEKKYNVPKMNAESCMVRLCTEFATENKSDDFMDGWCWFFKKAFPLGKNLGKSPSSVKIPDNANNEFIEGATKCYKLVEAFYSDATMLIVPNSEEI